MRVLTVGNLHPPEGGGGYEAVWRSFAAHMRERGTAVRVLCADGSGPDVHPELRLYWRDGEWLSRGALGSLAVERHNARVLERHLGELRPDVVMWWSMGGLSMSLIDRVRRAGVPCVGVVHDGWLAYGPQRDGWARLTRRRPDLAAAGTWTFNSAATLARAVHDGWQLPGAVVIHPGIDPARFAPSEPREWGWRLAYVGRVDPQKGVQTLLEALARLPDEASADICGPAAEDEVARLRSLAGGLGVAERVRFTGALAAKDVPGAYAAADAVVFPVTWPEPFGLVPLEAMAVGRPVVATGTGGSAEYLRDGENALLFAPGDADALAGAVERLGADPELRRRLRADGRRTAARFTEERFNRALEKVVQDVAASPSAILRARR